MTCQFGSDGNNNLQNEHHVFSVRPETTGCSHNLSKRIFIEDIEKGT